VRKRLYSAAPMLSFLLTVTAATIAALLRWLWRQRPRRAVVTNVFLWAIVLNYIWEVGQLPLFAGFASFHLWTAVRHCAWYTLGDATIVISLYGLGALGHRSWGWGLRLHRVDWLWLPLAGILVAIVIERLALHFGRWQYSPDMPTLPGVAVGVLPVVQMGLLPLLSIVLARCFVAHVISTTGSGNA
jgi:hypothetical protein